MFGAIAHLTPSYSNTMTALGALSNYSRTSNGAREIPVEVPTNNEPLKNKSKRKKKNMPPK